MSAFAPVAPIQVLEQLYEHDPKLFGEYHLLLAHHTVAYAERFSKLFSRIAADGFVHPTVIMDNSVVECGGYIDFDMMSEAAHIIADEGHDVIPVLPDVMGEGQATREATQEAYRRWEREIPHAGFMAVCQGNNFEDYMTSLRLFSARARFPHIEYLGIPRFLVETIGTRKEATPQALKYAAPVDMKVHLLGYSDNTYDDLYCSQIGGVAGIDSAVPLRVPGVFDYGTDYPPRPETWFETAKLTSTMIYNLQHVKRQHGFWDGAFI